MSPGATCAMEAAFRWQLSLERVRYAAGMPMADVWDVDGVITCVQSLAGRWQMSGMSGTTLTRVHSVRDHFDLRSSLNDLTAKHPPSNNRLKSIRLQELKIHISRFS